MRLFLSSHRFGDAQDRLVPLMRGGRRVCVISNALDLIPAEARAAYAAQVYDVGQAFAALGLEAEDLDLREHARDSEGLAARLRATDLVWVTGGNVFVLTRAMARCGFGPLIREGLARDALVYGGDSAGAVAAGPSLRGFEVMDPPDEVPEGYRPEAVWEGLRLIDFAIVPHHRSEGPDSPAAEALVRRFQAEGTPFRALSDGQALIADGGPARLCGAGR